VSSGSHDASAIGAELVGACRHDDGDERDERRDDGDGGVVCPVEVLEQQHLIGEDRQHLRRDGVGRAVEPDAERAREGEERFVAERGECTRLAMAARPKCGGGEGRLPDARGPGHSDGPAGVERVDDGAQLCRPPHKSRDPH
jgi:hypothetical protein